jgi:tetratricopeptide (TPR) repeat protein
MKNQILLLMLMTGLEAAWATPYLPSGDDVVLERLRKEIRMFSRGVRRSKTNDLVTACQEARQFIQLAQSSAEPRYLGYAQGALASWINNAEPPAGVRLLRAIIRQSNHHFVDAITDFDGVLTHDPRNREALVGKICALQAQGRILEARAACQKAPWLASDVIGWSLITTVASLNGQLESSRTFLEKALARAEGSATSLAWAWTALAEMSVRAGLTPEAEQAYARALELTPDDAYLLTSYADFLIDQDRSNAVLSFLKQRTGPDGLLLRLTLAEANEGNPGVAHHIAELRKRFESTRAAVGNLHAREEAIFELRLLHHPKEALDLALINWQNQREPLDARIVLESALASRDKAAAKPVLDWMDETKLEDVRLKSLRQKLENGKNLALK